MEAKLELNQRSLSVDIQLLRLYSNTIILNLNPRAEKKTHTYNCNLKPVKMPLKTMIRLKSLDDNRLKKYPTTHLQPFEIAPSSQTDNKWHSFLLFIWFYQSQIYTKKKNETTAFSQKCSSSWICFEMNEIFSFLFCFTVNRFIRKLNNSLFMCLPISNTEPF